MKNLLLPFLFVSSFANAAALQCYIETDAWDVPTLGGCGALEYTFDNKPNPVVWSLVHVTKPVQSVIWSDATASCPVGSFSCTTSIFPYTLNTGKATILYSDMTWEVVQAEAWFETGF